MSLSHVARSRDGFAAGALAAAEWLPGHPGVHTIEDMLFGDDAMTRFEGCGTALVTPFTDEGALDLRALRALVEWQIAEGIDFLVPCGSTGEAQTHGRRRARAGGGRRWSRSPRTGAGHGRRHEQRHRAARWTKPGACAALGVDDILTATPYYNKPTQEGLHRHFLAVADAVDPAGLPLQRPRPHRR